MKWGIMKYHVADKIPKGFIAIRDLNCAETRAFKILT